MGVYIKDMNMPKGCHEVQLLEWHNLMENPNDIPKKTKWYCCKIKSSDDLRMVFGNKGINSDRYDAWSEIDCPY